MARWTTATFIAVLSTTSAPAAAGADAGGSWRARADRAEAALRGDEAKLRFRHNIIHVIKLWQTAVKHSDGAAQVEALRREAEVWALLAHWSGRGDDARRAEAERREAAAAARRRARRAQAPVNADSPAERLAADLEAALAALPGGGSDAAPGGGRFAPDARCVSVARDDPLDVRKIVLDPGHGGDDEGAKNPDGVWEKDVNLAVALEVAARLNDFCVILTRRDDVFVSLADRVRIANDADADLFVSIHANGSRRTDFHGVETYVLATDARRYEGRLADREEELHGLAPPPHAGPFWSRDLRLLLADLAMRGATGDAQLLAERVQVALVDRLRQTHPDTKDLGVKSALFYVLLGVRMPSILVESGFMTNPVEGRRLPRPEHREQVARGIVDGVRAFVANRDSRRSGPGPVVARAK